jgi:VWFA-related protein
MAVPLAASPTPQQQQVFRSTAEIVPVFVTVTDRQGRLVPDLTRDAFQVLDNGKPQPLTLFDNTPQPLRMILLIDVSGSMFQNAPLIRRACIELLRNLATDDLARVGTFGDEITISPEFTRDLDALVTFIPETIKLNAPTPLWVAVDKAMTEFASATPGRRVIVVVSDSKDSGALRGGVMFTPQDISQRAQREDVMVYGVGLRSGILPGSNPMDAIANSFPDPNLGNVANETGGGYFELRPRDNLAETFARVAEELRRQYLIGFAPPARDGRTHKIEVRVTGDGLRPRARKSYVASK